jgi:hypothetical protein
MSTTDKIKRNKERKTTNSIESAHMQHPYAVQDAAVPGARNLAEATKLINQKGFSKVIENASVLELISPPSNPGGKTKYILPHLNMADGRTFEGYLCKIRLPEDVGCLPDPQDILDEINSGPSAKKAVEGANPADEKIKRINYFERVANHKTFAPLDPKNQKIPAPNSKVRVICFSEPHMYSGGSIEGFYEIIDTDDELFERGTLNGLLENFRQFYEASKSIVQAGSENVSSFVSQNTKEVNTFLGLQSNFEQDFIPIDSSEYSQQVLQQGSINKDVYDAAFSYADGSGGEYNLAGNGVIETIYHKGQVVLNYTGNTYCNGTSFTIAMNVINKRNLFANKTLREVKTFQQIWYGVQQSTVERQQGPALEYMGIGKNIPQTEAIPGDFAQIWRTNSSGHSVVFLGWVQENGKIVGLKYRSSQGRGPNSGVGNRTEYFSDTGKGSVVRQRTYISRIIV